MRARCLRGHKIFMMVPNAEDSRAASPSGGALSRPIEIAHATAQKASTQLVLFTVATMIFAQPRQDSYLIEGSCVYAIGEPMRRDCH